MAEPLVFPSLVRISLLEIKSDDLLFAVHSEDLFMLPFRPDQFMLELFMSKRYQPIHQTILTETGQYQKILHTTIRNLLA